tara:strand:- start:775 stop:1158 length:384 start_codon:yes stop_codon:yes gene_type:complete
MVMGDALAMSLMELNDFQPNDFAQIHPSGSLGKKLHLKVIDLLGDSKIPRSSVNSTLNEVIYEISEKRLGARVVEKNGEVCGLITDGDIRRVLEKHEKINHLIVFGKANFYLGIVHVLDFIKEGLNG